MSNSLTCKSCYIRGWIWDQPIPICYPSQYSCWYRYWHIFTPSYQPPIPIPILILPDRVPGDLQEVPSLVCAFLEMILYTFRHENSRRHRRRAWGTTLMEIRLLLPHFVSVMLHHFLGSDVRLNIRGFLQDFSILKLTQLFGIFYLASLWGCHLGFALLG